MKYVYARLVTTILVLLVVVLATGCTSTRDSSRRRPTVWGDTRDGRPRERSGTRVIRRDGRIITVDRNGRVISDRRDDTYDDDDYGDYDRDDRSGKSKKNSKKAKNGGPAFCRSGEGHPVYGRQWCIDKGYGLGGRYDDRRYDDRRYDDRRYDPVWENRRWDDVIFRNPRVDRRLDNRSLGSLLGAAVYNRIESQRRYLGAGEPITAYWEVGARGERRLNVFSGPMPVAVLVDANRDNRVDLVMLNRRR